MKEVHELIKDYMIRPKGMFQWRDIPGWEGRYQMSNHGEVCSILDRVIAENDTQVVLIGIDKTRHSMSRNKLLKSYWGVNDHYKGTERWKRIDHYGDYYISNYANVKNCRRQIVYPTDGKMILIDDNRRESVSVLKLFLNTFPPGEIEMNEENRTVNWKKA